MLTQLKVMLGMPYTQTPKDEQLQLILDSTTNRLKSLLGGIDPPEELEYIILEVAVIRYNRIGSEGLSAHSVEGESQRFGTDDFAAYREDIRNYLAGVEQAKKGRVRFL